MKRGKFLILFLWFTVGVFAAPNEKDSVLVSTDSVTAMVDSVPPRKVKQGWNFGVLPSVAYDADLGFQGGLLGNVYFYGDGSQYPDYIHSLFLEASYSTKHYGTVRFNYDSRYVIPNHRLTLDATYLPDAMCDFYGFNGYQSKYKYEWQHWNKDPEKMDTLLYQSRAYYKYRRDFIRVSMDVERELPYHLKVNMGIGVLGYIISRCDFQLLNSSIKKEKDSIRYLDPSVEGLYDKYIRWGLIHPSEQKGGWHPYLRLGVTYDTRDQQACPTRGIHTDVFFTYSAAFNSSYYGNQAAAGYNHLQFNFTFRHYVSVYRNRVIFAYRLGTQNLIAGKSPYYMNTYLNTLFIQRVLYEGLGGGNSLRGVLRNRILANGYAYANIEWRFRIVDFDIKRQHFYLGLTPFFDMGLVTQPYRLDEEEVRSTIAACNERDGKSDHVDDFFSFSKKDIYRPHMSAGIGLKAAMNENFILSVDWAAAFDQQDCRDLTNFYVKMGYLF